MVGDGDEAVLVERVQDDWTMARVFHLVYDRVVSRRDVESLRDAPFTSGAMRGRMEQRLTTPSRLA